MGAGEALAVRALRRLGGSLPFAGYAQDHVGIARVDYSNQVGQRRRLEIEPELLEQLLEGSVLVTAVVIVGSPDVYARHGSMLPCPFPEETRCPTPHSPTAAP